MGDDDQPFQGKNKEQRGGELRLPAAAVSIHKKKGNYK